MRPIVVSVTGQATGLDEFAAVVHRGDRRAYRQGDDLIVPSLKEYVRRDEQRASSQVTQVLEGRFEFAFVSGMKEMNRSPKRMRCGLHLFGLGRICRRIRIDEHGY